MIRPIVIYPNPVLTQPAAPVEDFNSPELKQLVDDLFETMYAAPGLGLAAPQIGVSKRVAVVDLSLGEDPAQRLLLINPEITEEQGNQFETEGCLSLPGFRAAVRRPRRVSVRALGADGKAWYGCGDNLLAAALAHEIDHLDGRLFIDRLSSLKREMVKRKFRKQHERAAMMDPQLN